jgi:N4-gp56 family major capsid protein
MSARLLEVAELNTILDQFGDKHPLPANSSKTIQFTREEKLAVSTTPTQLSEGIPPDAVGITINQFQAITEQYGALVRLSDLAELTACHNLVERTIYILGLQAAETYDQLIYNVLNAGTTVYRPNNKANDAALVGSDGATAVDLIEVEATLNGNGARPFESGYYAWITSPQPYGFILKDPDFKAAAQFRAPEKIWRGEVGELYGFRVIRSNSPAFAATTQTAAGSSTLVYSSFGIGRFAYQISDLQNLRVYVVAPGGHMDPLQQSRKIGWKFAFKSLITNQNWLVVVRSSGLNSKTN